MYGDIRSPPCLHPVCIECHNISSVQNVRRNLPRRHIVKSILIDWHRFGSLSDLDHCRFWIISGFGSFLGKCSKSINDPNATMIQIGYFRKCFSIWNIISQNDRIGSFFWKKIDLDHFFRKWSIWIIPWGNFVRNDPNRSFPKIMIQFDLFAKLWSKSIIFNFSA